jgi:stage IV sporulation protein B
MKVFLNKEKQNRLKYFTVVLLLIISLITPYGAAQAKKEHMLVPMGNTVGIQIHTDGVMVVGLSAVREGTTPSPAATAGIVVGDVIVNLGGSKIANAEDFRKSVEKLDGGKTSVTVKRGEQTLQLTLEPVVEDGRTELGLWLRDTISGIGTLTFYDPQSGKFGALGHSINDGDSGLIMPMGHGRIMLSRVTGIIRGQVGAPGELTGTFDINSVCGSIDKNTTNGIFGELKESLPDTSAAVPMGLEKDLKLGKASILSSVNGDEAAEYGIEIVRVYRNDDSSRSMMIKVTDEKLLALTGGIVQGMSGSPILQDGKLVGAVTHVMINDPTMGFGIACEKMLKTAGGK